MPISTRVYNDIAMSTLNRITGDIQGIQQRIATGRNILKTSDDPAAGAKISFTKDKKIMLERYNANIDRAQNRLSQAEALSVLASICCSASTNWPSRHGTTRTMRVTGQPSPWKFAI